MTATDLMGVLTTLNPKQLQEVQARTSLLLGKVSTNPPAVEEKQELWIHDEVRRHFSSFGVMVPPLVAVRSSKMYPSYRAGLLAVLAYLPRFKPANRLEKLKALRIVLDLAIKSTQRMNGPAIARLGMAFSNVGLLVEDAFPGYRASGLLPAVLKMSRF